MDYKIQQDENRATALDEKVEKGQKQLSTLQKKITVSKQAAATFGEIEGMAKKTLLGKVELSSADWETVSGLAKEGVKSRENIKRMKEKTEALSREVADLKSRLARYGEGQGITDTMQYYRAKQRAPRRMAALIAEILCQPPEQQTPQKKKKREQEQSL